MVMTPSKPPIAASWKVEPADNETRNVEARDIEPRDPRPRFRGAITTLIMLLMAVLIVRDILGRRWASSPADPRAGGVTYRSSYGSEGHSPPPLGDA
jgi:hypothetical protein